VDKLVVSVGRAPNTQGLNAQGVGLKVNARGFLEVDDFCQTNLPGVFAIGDVVRGPMLAHKASEEGIMVAERLAGQSTQVHFDNVPWVIYTWPELAWVGKTEEQLKAAGTEYGKGVFPFMASGRARAMGETNGMVKILACKKTDTILGIHIYGPNASELISEAVIAMEFGGSTEDIISTIHAHPTLSEAMHEAALAVESRTIHI
jgi:dihydrolipoamide dehydrogenase